MNKYFIQLFLKENTVILPGFGVLTMLNDRLSQIEFIPDLNLEDSKLAGYISEIEGIDPQDAQNTIAKFIREIQSNLNRGESFDIFEFGSFMKNDVGAIQFTSWMTDKDVKTENSLERNDPVVNPVVPSPIVSDDNIQPTETISHSASNEIEKKKELSEHMDSVALIQALLNGNNEQDLTNVVPIKKNPIPEKKTIVSSEKEIKSQTDFQPIVKTSSIAENSMTESKIEEKKKKRKFLFWFFFTLLALLLVAILIGYNFKTIRSSFPFISDRSTKDSGQRIRIQKDTSKNDEIKDLSKELIFDSLPTKDQNRVLNDKKEIPNSKKNQSLDSNPKVKSTADNKKVFDSEPLQTQNEISKIKTVPKTVDSKQLGTFHIVSGAYKSRRYAEKRANILIVEGYNAMLLPAIQGFNQVVLKSFATKPEAIEYLRNQRKKGRKVWLLRKSLDDKS